MSEISETCLSKSRTPLKKKPANMFVQADFRRNSKRNFVSALTTPREIP